MPPFNRRRGQLTLMWDDTVDMDGDDEDDNSDNNNSDGAYHNHQSPPVMASGDGENIGLETLEMTPGNARQLSQQYNCLVYWYARFLVYTPVTVTILILVPVLAALAGGLTFRKHNLLSFDDPTEGFQTKHTAFMGKYYGIRGLSHDGDVARLSRRPNASLVAKQLDTSYGPLCASINDCMRSVDEMSTSFTFDDYTSSRYNSDLFETSDNDGSDNNDSVRTKRNIYTPSHACPALSVTPARYTRFFQLVFAPHKKHDDLFTLENLQALCDLEKKHFTMSAMPSCPQMSILSALLTRTNDTDCSRLTQRHIDDAHALLSECRQYVLPTKIVSSQAPHMCHGVNATFITNVLFYFADNQFYALDSNSTITNTRMSYTLMFLSNRNVSVDYYKDHFQGKHYGNSHMYLKAVYATDDVKFDIFTAYMLQDAILFGIAMLFIVIIQMFYMGSIILVIATIKVVGMSISIAYAVYVMVLGLRFFPFINVLASLIIIAVGVDDVFIIHATWQMAKQKMPSFGRDSSKMALTYLMSETLKHAAVSIAVTSLTTAAAFLANNISDVINIRCFGIFSGLCILSNLFLMVTWMLAVVAIVERFNLTWSFVDCMQRCYERGFSHWSAHQYKYITYKMEIMYKRFYELCVIKLRFLWLLLLPALGAGAAFVVFVSPKLQLPTSHEMQLFPADSFMEQWDQNLRERFRYAVNIDKADDLTISFVWGVDSQDNTKWWDVHDEGSLTLTNDFNLTTPAAMSWLSDFVSDLHKWDVVEVKSSSTVPTMYKTATQQCSLCASYLPPKFVSQCCSNSSTHYDTCVPALAVCPIIEKIFSPTIDVDFIDALYFDERNVPRVYTLDVTTKIPYSTSFIEMQKNKDKIDAFFSKHMKSAPKGLDNGYWVADFMFYDLQYALSHGTYYSIGFSLAVATVVMFVTTLNLIITVYAMLTIAMAIAITVAVIVFLGWHLGILESIVINLAVGLSIDFTIHYGVAYCESQEHKSSTKMHEGYLRVGGAVAMGALTTFASGAAVMPAHILVYQQMGTFLMLVMTFSWFYATFFFQSLCHVAGPPGNCCQLRIPWHRCSKRGASNTSMEPDGISILSVESDDSLLAI